MPTSRDEPSRTKGRKKNEAAVTKTEKAPQHLRWDEMELEWLNPSISRRLAVGEREMLGWIWLKKGAVVPAHKHLSEQITFILKGALKFTIHGEDYTVRSGEVLVIPSNVVHEAVALEDTDDFDCFSPLRKDWLTGRDLYLRTGRSYLKR
ncbi:MAG: cupin domain-containing protein [Nitrososphaerales archaeon]